MANKEISRGIDDAIDEADMVGYRADASDKLNQYLEAAVSDNTKLATEKALKHYRKVYRGPLPCSDREMALYLSHFAGVLKISTLEQRRSLIGKWHEREYGFNPNNSDLVSQTMRGIRATHNSARKQAKAMPVTILDRLVSALSEKRDTLREQGDQRWVRYSRDMAMVLTAFWFGLRSSELVSIRIRDVTMNWDARPPRLDLYIPKSKGDRQARGRSVGMEELPNLCPMHAIRDWLEDRSGGVDVKSSQENEDYLFSKVDRWGAVWPKPLHANSTNKLLKRLLEESEVGVEDYSSHSLRRGIANWVIDSGASLNELMDWVGWSDLRSAKRYVDEKGSLPNRLMARKNNANLSNSVVDEPVTQIGECQMDSDKA
jgi:integrase